MPSDVALGVPGPALGGRPSGEAARLRLLKFVTLFGIGGTERQVMTLAAALRATRFDIHLACLRRSGQLLEDLGPLAGAPLTEYGIRRLFDGHALRARLRFAAYVRRHRIGIVHTYNFYPNVFALPAARLAGAPLVVASIRDMGAYLTPLQRRVQRTACRFAHHVVVNAEAVRRWLVDEGYDPARISVIHNGTDLAKFDRRQARERLRQELGLPPEAPLVGVVSRLSPSKGFEYFLDAAARVAAVRDDVRFLVVGEAAPVDRDYPAALAARARRLGLERRVVFTGLRLDIPDVLAELAVSVLPSLSEGLSNVLLESMAAEVPVVATRVGGAAEAVEDGTTGLLVPPRDAAALADAVLRVLDDRDLGVRLGRAGRQRVARHFSMETAVRETERLYVRLLAERARAA